MIQAFFTRKILVLLGNIETSKTALSFKEARDKKNDLSVRPMKTRDNQYFLQTANDISYKILRKSPLHATGNLTEVSILGSASK